MEKINIFSSQLRDDESMRQNNEVCLNAHPFEPRSAGMDLIMFTANVVGQGANCYYPNRVVVSNAEELKNAIKMDHVCAEYENNYRKNENFRQSNVIVMDCDNDQTEDPTEWITPEKLDQMMPDISYAIAFSRHHMQEKNGKAPRPKFHVYFAIEPTQDAKHYAALKKAIYHKYPFFDGGALDAARFIFGASTGDVIWHEGNLYIESVVQTNAPLNDKNVTFAPPKEKETAQIGNAIIAGTRNATMSKFAGRIIFRFGNTDRAHQFFLDESVKCQPPLDDKELDAIWSSAVRWYENTVIANGEYVPPERYNKEALTLKPLDYSHIGEAKVLAQEYCDELRFTEHTGFLRYNGIYWQESDEKAKGVAMEFLDLQLYETNNRLASTKQALLDSGVPQDAVDAGKSHLRKAVSDNEELKQYYDEYTDAQQYHSFVMKCRDDNNMKSILNIAKPLLLMDYSQFDADPYLLNTPEGTYDLRKGMDGLREHNAKDYLSKCTNVSPGEKGKDLWLDTINLVFCGDRELIDYVQTIVGMAAVGKVYVEAIIISYGDGANGKSTFWNTLSRVLGNYSGTLNADVLTTDCRRNTQYELAELKGKRLVIAAELEEGKQLSTSMIKQIGSTDEIGAAKKFKDPFKFIPSHNVVLFTNHLPKVTASDKGTWRRLIVIPFKATIQGKSEIKNYTDFLVENAGPYIMKWVIEGAQKAIDSDFKLSQPRCVQDSISTYREENNLVDHFIEECCEVDCNSEQKSGELYDAYRNYCQQNGEHSRSTADFYRALESAGYQRRKKNTGRYVVGLKLRQPF